MRSVLIRRSRGGKGEKTAVAGTDTRERGNVGELYQACVCPSELRPETSQDPPRARYIDFISILALTKHQLREKP